MLGPGPNCWFDDTSLASARTGVRFQLVTIRRHFEPKTIRDMEVVLDFIKDFKTGIKQRKANIELGVKAGMVRTKDACKAGLLCMKRVFSGVGNTSHPLQWLKGFNLDTFVTSATGNTSSDWQKIHNQTMKSSLHQALVKNVEEPLAELFTYLENEHMKSCPPQNASSGMGTIPLKYVYHDEVETGERTNQTLGNGDQIVSGREAYQTVLSFYTTTNHTAGMGELSFLTLSCCRVL